MELFWSNSGVWIVSPAVGAVRGILGNVED